MTQIDDVNADNRSAAENSIHEKSTSKRP